MHPLKEMIIKRKQGIICGIPSYCSANELVLQAAIRRIKETGTPILIEATANQVNQFGGYTGMKPKDFMDFVLSIAQKEHVQPEKLILAGDHLGPLNWKDEPEQQAMDKAKELVRQYILAGFTKIHLDTSMKLGDDTEQPLETEVIARRGAVLYQACMEAYAEVQKVNPAAVRPVFVIGSEVPIPGGAQEAEESIHVTEPADFENTVLTYTRVFQSYGYENAWEDIIAIVVQPGVEFADAQIFDYDREKAQSLCEKRKEYPYIVFEGHSTDYQSPFHMQQMVEDGVAILKVGPALTFALREALFALSFMEKELVPAEKRADFIEILEDAMCRHPENWVHHYHGDTEAQALARKYSFSDRARYYIGEHCVVEAMNRLFENLREYPIPLNVLHQYMPCQYHLVHNGDLDLTPHNLVISSIHQVMREYEYAVGIK